jgi:hypothetical protein
MDSSPRQFPIGTVPPMMGWLMGRYPIGSALAGKVDPIGTDPTLICVGIARETVYTNVTPPTAQEVYVDPGIVPLFATGVDETWEGSPVYGVDNQTVQLSSGNGAYPLIGVGWYAESTTVIRCKVGPDGIAEAQAVLNALAAGKPIARVVMTAMPASTTANGTITVTATGATAAQDTTVTLALNDFVFLPPGQAVAAGLAASNAGVYQNTVLGAAGVKAVFERVALLSGQGWPLAYTAEVDGEGAEWGGSSWRVMDGKGKVVDTDDPAFYPRFWKKKVTLASGTYIIGAGGGGEDLYLWSATTTPVSLTANTLAGTAGTNKLAAPSATRTAGYPAAATITVNSYVDAGTVAGSDSTTVDVLVGPNF